MKADPGLLDVQVVKNSIRRRAADRKGRKHPADLVEVAERQH